MKLINYKSKHSQIILYLHSIKDPTIINGGLQPNLTSTGNSILPDSEPKNPNNMAIDMVMLLQKVKELIVVPSFLINLEVRTSKIKKSITSNF